MFRSDPKYLTSLGQSVINIIRLVPHGVLIFFPSYRFSFFFCLVPILVEWWDLQRACRSVFKFVSLCVPHFYHCCGSVTFWYGSRSADPSRWLTDPDPAFFISGWQDANKKKFFFQRFCAYYFWRYTICTPVYVDKLSKRSHKIGEIKFTYFFACWWKDLDPVSGRLKNIRIRFFFPHVFTLMLYPFTCQVLFPVRYLNLSTRTKQLQKYMY